MIKGPNFFARPSSVGDNDLLFELFMTSREREYLPLPENIRSTFARHQHLLHEKGINTEYPDAQTFIINAVDEYQVVTEDVGMVMLADRAECLWVIDVALRPDLRNIGLGSAIMMSLMDICRRDQKIMRGSVTPYNPARRLYSRLGIRELEINHGYISLEWRPSEHRDLMTKQS